YSLLYRTMARPNLYRSGNTTSPRFDNVRKGKDIQVDKNDNVILGSGGVSTFTAAQQGWKPQSTWILPGTANIGSHLKALNDHGAHWLIAPASEMSFNAYVDYLKPLNSMCHK
ncbi:uncharacterized protein LAESUDRAFT_607747, partial [Laetiporus sulphureus 93-53]